MTHTYKWFCLICLLAATRFAVAQDGHFMAGTAYSDAVTLQFFPLTPAEWSRAFPASYQVVRVEMDNGQPLSTTRTTIAQQLKPQNTAWFEQHKAEEQGMMEAIGALLYDTSFQFADKSVMDADSMRWNYVMYEVLNRPAIGFAVGNMVVDTTVQPGKMYRYTLTSANFPGLRQNLDILCAAGNKVQQPRAELVFQFPDDRSLSDMLPKAEQQPLPQVFALAKAYGDSIMVRWAPNTPALWFASLDKGYHLLRAELQAGIEFPRFDTLAFVKPLPQAQAFNLVRANATDSLAALAAGLLYNQATPPPPGPMTEQAQVFETKFGFALFAAEGSKTAARILGLGYMDKSVQAGKTYTYRLVAADAPDFFSQAEVSVLNEKKRSAAPIGFNAQPSDRLIELHWESGENARLFSAYELERSEDGKLWQKLHQKPLTFFETEALTFPDFRFRDSVAANYKDYRYRLRGLDSFGEWGTWAEVKSQAVDLTPPPMADLTKSVYNDTTNTALIQWRTAELPDDFKAFYLLLSEDVDAPADTLAQLGRAAREFLWKPDSLLSGNRGYFFRILTVDKRGNAARSLERYMTVPDITAPLPPARLAGNIDEDGNVTVVWELSTDKDVRGYWIYAANDPSIEFPVLNKDILTENSYTWQVASRSLNKYLYVVVAAEDTHFNRGETSNILKLKRPDKVPPIVPFMESAMQEGNFVQVKWRPSSSEDCTQYQLLRRETGKTASDWALLDTLAVFETEHRDTFCYMDRRYQYAIIAVDDSGNRSDTSNVVSADFKFKGDWATIKNLKVAQAAPEVAAIHLTWEMNAPSPEMTPVGSYQFLVFRSIGNDNPSYLATVPGSQNNYTDTEVLNGVAYNYSVQVQYGEAGELGQRSATKSVLTVGKNPTKPAREKPTGTAPAELVARGRGLLVSNGDESPSQTDDTDFGKVGTGSIAMHQFAIQNSGELELKLPEQPVTLEGSDLSVWAIIQPKTKVRGYGSSELFTIEFRPKTEGEFIAKVKIAGDHPYEFTIKGTGTRKPELEVQGNQLSILNKDASPTPTDNTDFGGVGTGTKATRIFMLKNIGVDPLRLAGVPILKGDIAFAITNFKMPKGNVLPAGAEVPIIISFLPMETGVHNASLTIISDDEDENPFTFAVQGVGAGPEVCILGENEAVIALGAITPNRANGTDIGEVKQGNFVTKQFIVKNLGDRSLNLTGRPRVNLSGSNASDFKVVKDPAPQVKPGGGEEVFSIEFRPKAVGLREAVITVENNDANEGSYQFTIQGTGL